MADDVFWINGISDEEAKRMNWSGPLVEELKESATKSFLVGTWKLLTDGCKDKEKECVTGESALIDFIHFAL